MFEKLRMGLARLIAPKGKASVRMYSSARASRLAGSTPSNSSADIELVTSLTAMRGRSRQLGRDASYAKRARVLVQNNVIGTGIGLQCQVKSTRGELNKAVNDAIEEAFDEWSRAENCHTGGTLHFHDLERAAMAQVFDAGEVFIRKHYRPFGRSKVPFALEMIEAERIADETSGSPRSGVPNAMVRMGVEVDEFYRPLGYFIRQRHQGEFRLGVSRTDMMEWVPADQIWHLKITDRWPQTRGEPWLHTAILRLQDMDGYSEAEIVAARAAANYFGTIKMGDDPASPVGGDEKPDGSVEMAMEAGMVKKLGPGEEFNFHAPNRPNTALDPFMRYMLREVAAGIGVSYASLSMDYSQSNYSSSRLALLDDRDLWRFYQGWFIRMFRCELHRELLQQMVFARTITQIPLEAFGLDPARYYAARFKPRGWSWIDPTSEVEAYIMELRAGFTDVGTVISQTAEGRDLEDVLEAREQELKLMKAHGLKFDTDPDNKADGAPAKEPKPEPKPAAPAAADPDDDEDEEEDRKPAARVVSFK